MTSPLPLDLQSAYIQQTWLPTQTYHAHLWATSGVVVKLTAHMLVDALPCHFAFSPEAAKIRNLFVTRSEANGLRIWHEHSQRPRISKPVCYPFGGRLALKFARALPEAAKIRNLFVTRSEANGLRIWHEHSQRPRISKPVCYPFGGRLALKFARALPEAAKIRNLFVTRSEANGLRIWHQSGM